MADEVVDQSVEAAATDTLADEIADMMDTDETQIHFIDESVPMDQPKEESTNDLNYPCRTTCITKKYGIHKLKRQKMKVYCSKPTVLDYYPAYFQFHHNFDCDVLN